MQTVQGVRFLPLARVHGTLLGLDARWLGRRGLLIVVLLTMATPSGPLSPDPSVPAWARVGFGLCSVLGVLATSLGHEVGHALAGRIAGLRVRAIVLAPHGGLTIRGTSDHAHINFRTALAGPLANALLGTLCAAAAAQCGSVLVMQLAVLQLLTALVNLAPIGRTDGAHLRTAWRALGAPAPAVS